MDLSSQMDKAPYWFVVVVFRFYRMAARGGEGIGLPPPVSLFITRNIVGVI